MGEMPRWFRLIQAARYLNTTPWDLEDKGWRYVLQAEEARYSENYANQHHADRTNTM